MVASILPLKKTPKTWICKYCNGYQHWKWIQQGMFKFKLSCLPSLFPYISTHMYIRILNLYYKHTVCMQLRIHLYVYAYVCVVHECLIYACAIYSILKHTQIHKFELRHWNYIFHSHSVWKSPALSWTTKSLYGRKLFFKDFFKIF